MSIKISELIKKLEPLDPDKRVEFVVVEEKGTLICVDVKDHVGGIIRLLKYFVPAKKGNKVPEWGGF